MKKRNPGSQQQRPQWAIWGQKKGTGSSTRDLPFGGERLNPWCDGPLPAQRSPPPGLGEGKGPAGRNGSASPRRVDSKDTQDYLPPAREPCGGAGSMERRVSREKIPNWRRGMSRVQNPRQRPGSGAWKRVGNNWCTCSNNSMGGGGRKKQLPRVGFVLNDAWNSPIYFRVEKTGEAQPLSQNRRGGGRVLRLLLAGQTSRKKTRFPTSSVKNQKNHWEIISLPRVTSSPKQDGPKWRQTAAPIQEVRKKSNGTSNWTREKTTPVLQGCQRNGGENPEKSGVPKMSRVSGQSLTS